MQVTIYVVTRSDTYYPVAGAEDWELVTRDFVGAVECAARLFKGMPDRIVGGGMTGSVHVLAVDEDSLQVRELSGVVPEWVAWVEAG